jgi:dephospho-CoA kinase
VALTGGIATGKSYCLRAFVSLGVPVIDADLLSHAAIAPGTPGFDAVVRRFGRRVVATSGEIDRPALGRIVFTDDDARRALESIVHPIVHQTILEWFEAGHDSREHFRIADIPLLYETGGARDVDRVIVAACSRAEQMARLASRGLSAADAEARLAAQWPIEEKARLADYLISTSGSTDETERQVIEVVERLRAESADLAE